MHHLSALSCGIRGAENGVARIYARGTNTRATYYTNFEATVSYTADITLNSRGQATTYVNQLVKVVIFDSDGDEVIRWDDGVNATAVEIISPSVVGTDYITAAAGVNKPTTLQAFLALWTTYSGGQPWPLVDPFDTGTGLGLAAAIGLGQGGEFNVKKYGAVGDGTTNDSAAITNAIGAAQAAGGGVVVFPPGTYKITASIDPGDGVSLLGSGSHCTTISLATAATKAVDYDCGGGGAFIAHLAIVSSVTNTSYALAVEDGQYVIIGCKIGGEFDGNCVGIGGTGNTAITTIVSMSDCQIILGTGGSSNDGIEYNCNGGIVRANISNCYFSCTAGALQSGDAFIGPAGVAGNDIVLNVSSCIFNAVAVTSGGTFYGLDLKQEGTRVSVTGCAFLAPTGGTFCAIGHDTGDLSEYGNQFESGVTAYEISSTIADIAASSIQLGSREGRKLLVANDTTGAQTVDALGYGTIVWQRTTNGTQTPTLATAPEGSRFTLVWWNDHGAGGGTITLAAASGALRSEFASEQFTVAANSIRMISFRSVIINGANRWIQDGESTDDETE